MPRQRRSADTFEAGSRVPLNVRTTVERRSRLEKAADANGRSLLAELEIRLDQSFTLEDSLAPKTTALFRSLASNVALFHGDSWLTDRELGKGVADTICDTIRLHVALIPVPGTPFQRSVADTIAAFIPIAGKAAAHATARKMIEAARGLVDNLAPGDRDTFLAEIAAAEALLKED